MPKLYPLGDRPTRKECEVLGLDPETERAIWKVESRKGQYARAVRTGSKRPPHKGEWFLSGAIPRAYRAPNDFSVAYHILRLVKVTRCEKITYTLE